MANPTSKRLQVFLSSTYLDLLDECQAVVETILSLGHQPAGMGMFSVGLPTSLPLVQDWIAASDVFVLLLGNRYGELDPESGKSLIQLEYECAIATQKPIIALVVDNDTLADRVEAQGLEIVEAEQFDKLEQFRATVTTEPIHLWRNMTDLEQALTERLTALVQQETVLGWMRPTTEQTVPEQTTETPPESPSEPIAASATIPPQDLTILLQTVQILASSLQRVVGVVNTADQVNQKAAVALQDGEEAVDTTVANLLQLQEIVADSARTSKRLAEVSQQMTKVVQLMNQVASRTNMLALNANIEVSRLGSRSEGFMQVAEEMRQLATHTAKVSQAVEKITAPLQTKANKVLSTLGQGIQQSLVGAQQAQQTQQSLAHLGQVATEIEQLWNEIATTTTAQSELSAQVTRLLQTLDWQELPPLPDLQQITVALQNLAERIPEQPLTSTSMSS